MIVLLRLIVTLIILNLTRFASDLIRVVSGLYTIMPSNAFYLTQCRLFDTGLFGAVAYHPIYLLEERLQARQTLIARFMRPTWGPPGDDRTHAGPMLAT